MRPCPGLSSLGHVHRAGLTAISNARGRKPNRAPCRSRLKIQSKSPDQVRGGVLFNGDQPARVVSFIAHLDGLNGHSLGNAPTIYP